MVPYNKILNRLVTPTHCAMCALFTVPFFQCTLSTHTYTYYIICMVLLFNFTLFVQHHFVLCWWWRWCWEWNWTGMGESAGEKQGFQFPITKSHSLQSFSPFCTLSDLKEKLKRWERNNLKMWVAKLLYRRLVAVGYTIAFIEILILFSP